MVWPKYCTNTLMCRHASICHKYLSNYYSLRSTKQYSKIAKQFIYKYSRYSVSFQRNSMKFTHNILHASSNKTIQSLLKSIKKLRSYSYSKVVINLWRPSVYLDFVVTHTATHGVLYLTTCRNFSV